MGIVNLVAGYVALVVLAILVGGALARMAQAEALPAPARRPDDPDRAGDGPPLQVAVVFCTWATNSVVLDCVMVDRQADGWPVTFAVGLPEAAPSTCDAAQTLQRWADDCQPVVVHLEPVPDLGTMVLSDGTTTVRLGVGHGATVAPVEPRAATRRRNRGSDEA